MAEESKPIVSSPNEFYLEIVPEYDGAKRYRGNLTITVTPSLTHYFPQTVYLGGLAYNFITRAGLNTDLVDEAKNAATKEVLEYFEKRTDLFYFYEKYGTVNLTRVIYYIAKAGLNRYIDSEIHGEGGTPVDRIGSAVNFITKDDFVKYLNKIDSSLYSTSSLHSSSFEDLRELVKKQMINDEEKFWLARHFFKCEKPNDAIEKICKFESISTDDKTRLADLMMIVVNSIKDNAKNDLANWDLAAYLSSKLTLDQLCKIIDIDVYIAHKVMPGKKLFLRGQEEEMYDMGSEKDNPCEYLQREQLRNIVLKKISACVNAVAGTSETKIYLIKALNDWVDSFYTGEVIRTQTQMAKELGIRESTLSVRLSQIWNCIGRAVPMYKQRI